MKQQISIQWRMNLLRYLFSRKNRLHERFFDLCMTYKVCGGIVREGRTFTFALYGDAVDCYNYKNEVMRIIG